MKLGQTTLIGVNRVQFGSHFLSIDVMYLHHTYALKVCLWFYIKVKLKIR